MLGIKGGLRGGREIHTSLSFFFFLYLSFCFVSCFLLLPSLPTLLLDMLHYVLSLQLDSYHFYIRLVVVEELKSFTIISK